MVYLWYLARAAKLTDNEGCLTSLHSHFSQ